MILLAWVTGSELYVNTIDRNYLNSLKKIKSYFKKIYPGLNWDGKIIPERVIEGPKNNRTSAAMLFSHGVDSIDTFIRHKKEVDYLITIWGGDIGLNQKILFDIVKSEVSSFSKTNNIKPIFIKSNFSELFNQFLLSSFFANTLSDSWWGNVQHGIGMLSLCAPISLSYNIEKIFIPSTFSKNLFIPWGSTPYIDNNFRWSNTRIIHEGYEYNRQEKLKNIARYIKDGAEDFIIRVCYKSKDILNCNKCEKCSKTIVGLLVEGINPNNHGFLVNHDTFKNIKSSLIKGKFKLRVAQIQIWNDIKSEIDFNNITNIEGSKEFFKWLNIASMASFKRTSEKRHWKSSLLKKLIKFFYLPFNMLYHIFIAKKLY